MKPTLSTLLLALMVSVSGCEVKVERFEIVLEPTILDRYSIKYKDYNLNTVNEYGNHGAYTGSYSDCMSIVKRIKTPADFHRYNDSVEKIPHTVISYEPETRKPIIIRK